jgi:hypothetical protein
VVEIKSPFHVIALGLHSEVTLLKINSDKKNWLP